jgi:uncharacterized protein with HEPN domain
MPRRVDVILLEVLGAIDGIENALRDQTRAAFSQNWFMQRGTERGLEIISEAVRLVDWDCGIGVD